MKYFLLSALTICSVASLLSGCTLETKQDESEGITYSQQIDEGESTSMAFSSKDTFEVCADKNSQIELNQCARSEFESSEKELETVYQQFYTKNAAYMDKTEMDNLDKSQETWKQYREQFCLFVSDAYEGGTIRPYMASSCLNDLTRARIRSLEMYQ